jgi:RNA polymerase sigma-70 factor, ECF subfamily
MLAPAARCPSILNHSRTPRSSLASRPDPADQVLTRETFRLALLMALERLPARQRAALILREALCWKTNEIAELLETSDAAVNSALQRARASLESIGCGDDAKLRARTDDSPARLLASCLVALGPTP